MKTPPPQLDLFAAQPANRPPGLSYQPEGLSGLEEAALIAWFATLAFAPFEFHGFQGNRRIVSFGWRYDFSRGAVAPVEPIPDFLDPLRTRAAGFAGVKPGALEHAMVTEYRPGAGIGWHRDRPEFGVVVGVSLGSEAVLRLRRHDGAGWERRTLELAPRSIYVLDGEVREAWQHSITPGEQLRYSVTFRTFRRPAGDR